MGNRTMTSGEIIGAGIKIRMVVIIIVAGTKKHMVVTKTGIISIIIQTIVRMSGVIIQEATTMVPLVGNNVMTNVVHGAGAMAEGVDMVDVEDALTTLNMVVKDVIIVVVQTINIEAALTINIENDREMIMERGDIEDDLIKARNKERY